MAKIKKVKPKTKSKIKLKKSMPKAKSASKIKKVRHAKASLVPKEKKDDLSKQEVVIGAVHCMPILYDYSARNII